MMFISYLSFFNEWFMWFIGKEADGGGGMTHHIKWLAMCLSRKEDESNCPLARFVLIISLTISLEIRLLIFIIDVKAKVFLVWLFFSFIQILFSKHRQKEKESDAFYTNDEEIIHLYVYTHIWGKEREKKTGQNYFDLLLFFFVFIALVHFLLMCVYSQTFFFFFLIFRSSQIEKE